jgi:hypothetical protein
MLHIKKDLRGPVLECRLHLPIRQAKNLSLGLRPDAPLPRSDIEEQ